jgi:hypothetical protein
LAATGLVHHDLPHGGGGHGEEVLPIVPVEARPIEELEVGLVDERRGVKGTVVAPRKVAVRHGTQLLVNER